MTIPEVRRRLEELAVTHGLPELRRLAAELKRRPYVRKARAKSQKMTDDLRVAIQIHAQVFPEKSYVEIANVFDVNPGRVSEVLAGFRE